MPSLHRRIRGLAVLATLLPALAACHSTASEATFTTSTNAPPPPIASPTALATSSLDRYPADVYLPSGYTAREVRDAGDVLTIHGTAPGDAAALLQQARATMPWQGWREARLETSPTAQTLVFEKSGAVATLTFEPTGDATLLRMQLRRTEASARTAAR